MVSWRLHGPLLRSVSRSFYLSIQLLPTRLRDPVALAYLLARATDTIADTAELSASSRMENLQLLANAIQGKLPAEVAGRLRQSFAAMQKNAAERALIEALPAYVEWLGRMDDLDRIDIRETLIKINRGQALDVERFAVVPSPRALSTASELDEYTYLVAGCVGEFWTQLCFRHLRNFSKFAPVRMLELGKRYGMGLQLINIIRDASSDLRIGRCYFPAEELAANGTTLEEVLHQPARLDPILSKWREAAKGGIAAGLDYSCAIENRRVRFATVLPALIGARTLALLRDAGPDALSGRVKVPRAEVRAIMLTAVRTFVARQSLRKSFERLSGPM